MRPKNPAEHAQDALEAVRPIMGRAKTQDTLLTVTLRAIGEVQRGEREGVELGRAEAVAVLTAIQELRRDLGLARAHLVRLKTAREKADERAEELRDVVRRGRELLEALGKEGP